MVLRFTKHLTKEHENEENEEFKEDISEINNTNESKLCKNKNIEALISTLIAKQFPLKVTQAFIFSINTYEQYMIAVGNEFKIKNNNNKNRWNYCHLIHML